MMQFWCKKDSSPMSVTTNPPFYLRAKAAAFRQAQHPPTMHTFGRSAIVELVESGMVGGHSIAAGTLGRAHKTRLTRSVRGQKKNEILWDVSGVDNQSLFTGKLRVEAGEGDAEGLQGAHGVAVVHGEDVLGHPAELHDDVLWISLVDDLEVFDARLGDASMEVEHVGLGVVVPHRGLVVQLQDGLHVFGLVPLNQAVAGRCGLEVDATTVWRHPWHHHSHPARPLEPQHIGVVNHPHQLLPLATSVLQRDKQRMNTLSIGPKKPNIFDAFNQMGFGSNTEHSLRFLIKP